MFWIYLLLLNIFIKLGVDAWVIGLFVFEYGKEDTVL